MLQYRSKAARAGAALTVRLFAPPAKETGMWTRDDCQASIRSAVRRRRRTLGLTQSDMACLLRMSRLSYHRIECGGRRIHFAELAALCLALRCGVGELLQDGQLAAAYVQAAYAFLGEHHGNGLAEGG